MYIQQPHARSIPARLVGEPKVSGIGNISFGLTINAIGGASASVTLPSITSNVTEVFLTLYPSAIIGITVGDILSGQRNASASVDISLSTGPVKIGSKLSADLSLSTNAISSKQYIGTGNIVLPKLITGISTTNISVKLPLLSVTASILSNIESTSVGWITNLTNEETTKFLNYDFINIIRLGNYEYGLKSDGLYRLDSSYTTDNSTSITANIQTHPQNFKQQTLKRIPYIYLQTSNPVSVTSFVDSLTIGPFVSIQGQQKVNLSKGSQGYYWSWKLENVSGNSFKLDGIEPFIEFLKRRA